jgi:hypothetical protein
VKTNLGRINFRVGRIQQHVGKVQFLMVLYLTMDSLKTRYGVSFWWIFLFFPAIFVVHWIDKKYIFPTEIEVATNTNPEWILIMSKIDKILKHLRI